MCCTICASFKMMIYLLMMLIMSHKKTRKQRIHFFSRNLLLRLKEKRKGAIWWTAFLYYELGVNWINAQNLNGSDNFAIIMKTSFLSEYSLPIFGFIDVRCRINQSSRLGSCDPGCGGAFWKAALFFQNVVPSLLSFDSFLLSLHLLRMNTKNEFLSFLFFSVFYWSCSWLCTILALFVLKNSFLQIRLRMSFWWRFCFRTRGCRIGIIGSVIV